MFSRTSINYQSENCMKLSRLILISSFILAFGHLQAQNIGVTAGISFAKMNFDAPEGAVNFKILSIPTYRGGFTFENTLIKNKFFLEFSLLAAGRGFKIEDSDMQKSLHYIEIPMSLKYKIAFSKQRHFGTLLSAGGYIGGGYAGKDQDGNKIKFGKEETDDFKPLDYGIIPGFGFYFGPVQLSWNANFGLADVSTIGSGTSHLVHSISITYFFVQD